MDNYTHICILKLELKNTAATSKGTGRQALVGKGCQVIIADAENKSRLHIRKYLYKLNQFALSEQWFKL